MLNSSILLAGNLFAMKRFDLLLFNLFFSLTFSHNPALQCDCQTISHLYDIRSNIEHYDYLESQCDANKKFPENVLEVLHHCKIKKILLSTLIPCLGKWCAMVAEVMKSQKINIFFMLKNIGKSGSTVVDEVMKSQYMKKCFKLP